MAQHRQARREGSDEAAGRITLLELVTAAAREARSDRETLALVARSVQASSERIVGEFRAEHVRTALAV